jgi:hypothetical protein
MSLNLVTCQNLYMYIFHKQIIETRPCLVSNTKVFNFVFTFFKNNQHQNIPTFFNFYITSIIFYYYSNKKNFLQYKTLSLFYINYFYFISHLSIFTNLKTLSPLFCYVHSLAKHTQNYKNKIMIKTKFTKIH